MNYHHHLGTLWSEVVSVYPHNKALIYGDRVVTYQELDRLVIRVEAWMRSHGVVTGDIVAIVNTKEPISYASMLACLQMGVGYTNIDRDNPVSRSESILNQCKPRCIVADCKLCEKFLQMTEAIGVPCRCLNEERLMEETDEGVTSEVKEETQRWVTGARIAYIMFTSGSTGVPKGVAITQQSVLSFIKWSIDRYRVTPKDVFANISPMYFDNSVFDFYTALFSGAALAPIKKEVLGDPKALLSLVDKLQCTIWFSVPSMLIYLLTMRALNKESFKHIRVVTFGGEGFPKTELKKLYDLFSDRMEIINVYGPTEGTCICSAYTIDEAVFESMDGLPTLGTINPNFDFLVLNERDEPEQQGELCILGPNIAIGYYNDPERTQKSFLLWNHHNHYKTPMYRTGDLVRVENNLLYFCGRKDNQIKHMGFRIELEEIELALNSIATVHQAAVIYERVSDAYGKIIAFVATDTKHDANGVREQLKMKLPDYMLPNTIQFMSILPKNANGKVDRVRLQASLIV